MKKYTSVFLSFLLCTLLIHIPVSAADNSELDSNVLTVSEYEDYLKNYNAKTAEDSGVSPEYVEDAVANSSKILKKFESLSFEQKKLFVKNLTEIQKHDENSSQQEIDSEKISTLAKAKTSTKTVSKEIYYSFIGAPTTGYKTKVSYQVSSGKVKKIASSDAYVTYNYNPMVKTGLDNKSAWVTSDNKAAIQSRFYYRLGPIKGISMHAGYTVMKIVGNKNGTVTYFDYWKIQN